VKLLNRFMRKDRKDPESAYPLSTSEKVRATSKSCYERSTLLGGRRAEVQSHAAEAKPELFKDTWEGLDCTPMPLQAETFWRVQD